MDARSASYRDVPAMCPGCGTVMDVVTVGAESLDVCGQCSGIFVDWFDGEIQALLEGYEASSGGPARTQLGSQTLGPCPKCRVPMTEDVHARSGANIFRCTACGGAFVPLKARAPIVFAGPDPDTVTEPTAWDRLVTFIGSMFASTPP